MSIKTEKVGVFEDGSDLIRTYSDINHYIERDGVMYIDAIDPESAGREYSETDVEIEEEN